MLLSHTRVLGFAMVETFHYDRFFATVADTDVPCMRNYGEEKAQEAAFVGQDSRQIAFFFCFCPTSFFFLLLLRGVLSY